MVVNGKEVTVEADEGQSFSRAEELFTSGSYKDAIAAYADFLKRFPKSHLIAKAQYQMGNAYYLQKDYKNALKNQSAVVRRYPKNPVTPDAMLNMASCQIGLSDLASARKTLSELIRKYPGTEAAKKAKERLAQLWGSRTSCSKGIFAIPFFSRDIKERHAVRHSAVSTGKRQWRLPLSFPCVPWPSASVSGCAGHSDP